MTNKGLIGVISLGCDKNRVDSEVMLHKLTEYGFELTNDPSAADALVINTCAFLESARKEAIDTILEMAKFKQCGNCKVVVVTGCLGQKYGDEVFEHLTEADIIVGIDQYDNLPELIDQKIRIRERIERVLNVNCSTSTITEGNRILTTQKHFAYLKISEGCNNYCTYCLIPYIRGAFRSRTVESIVAEAKMLADAGVKELILVAQDVTKYGTDIYGHSRIVELVQELTKIDNIEWLRLMYCYPELVTDQLIDEIACNSKVVKYVDIPLQHIDDGMLRLMNRRSSEDGIIKLFDKLAVRGIEARTTFICGFPSETDSTIQKIYDFLTKYKLRNVGFFAYSREQGTKAYDFEQQVPQSLKNKYVKKCYSIQRKIVAEHSKSEVQKIFKTIVDRQIDSDDNHFVYIGRTEFMCPDIDGVVYIHSTEALQIGEFYDIAVTQAQGYDLIGEVTNELTK